MSDELPQLIERIRNENLPDLKSYPLNGRHASFEFLDRRFDLMRELMADTENSWHYARGGAQMGPVSTETLRQLAHNGHLQRTDLIWRPGMTEWLPASREPSLFPVATAGLPLPPPMPVSPPLAYAHPAPYPQPPDIGQDAGMRLLIPVGRSGWAIAAGYLGLISILILPAPFALIISIIAIRDIRRNPKHHGMGRAVFGLIMGALGTAVLCIGVVVRMLK